MKKPAEFYVAYFDSLGFECVINLSSYEKRVVWNTLAEKSTEQLPIYMMIMRAKANPQRFPEIWTFWSSMAQQELLDCAKQMPQELADSIRRTGSKVFVSHKEKEVIK